MPWLSITWTVEIRGDFDVAFPKQLKKKMNGDGSKKNHTIW
jgi:hypothetical protein